MIGTIEQAILDRVRAASDSGTLGYVLGQVTSYGGELDEDIATLMRGRFPAVWCVFSGKKDAESPRGKVWRASFAVLVAARGGRNEAERRHGADDRVGAYQLAEDVERLLDGQTLGLDLEEPIKARGVRTLFNGAAKGQRLAVYAIDLVAAYLAEPMAEAEGLDDFRTFHADWDIPPRGSVAPPLPAADADARDTLTLEQE